MKIFVIELVDDEVSELRLKTFLSISPFADEIGLHLHHDMLVFIPIDYRKLRMERQVVARADDEGIGSLGILHKARWPPDGKNDGTVSSRFSSSLNASLFAESIIGRVIVSALPDESGSSSSKYRCTLW